MIVVFLDTNIALYSLSNDERKAETVDCLLSKRPFISVQVVNEFINVGLRKLGFSREEIYALAVDLMKASRVVSLTEETVFSAMRIATRYKFSHWDSLIVATAIQAQCNILHSEDLQHGQKIEGLTILNPFAPFP